MVELRRTESSEAKGVSSLAEEAVGGMMEKKRSVGVTVFALLWFIIGIYNIFIMWGYVTFLIIGLICIILSFGIFKLFKSSRITLIIFSLGFIVLFVRMTTTFTWRTGFEIIALAVTLPTALLSFISIFYLTRPKVKAQFSPP